MYTQKCLQNFRPSIQGKEQRRTWRSYPPKPLERLIRNSTLENCTKICRQVPIFGCIFPLKLSLHKAISRLIRARYEVLAGMFLRRDHPLTQAVSTGRNPCSHYPTLLRILPSLKLSVLDFSLFTTVF
jgi:hypothetical protein